MTDRKKKKTAASSTTAPMKIASKAPSAAVVRRTGVYKSNDEQCAEITNNHTRCNNNIVPGTSFCYLHQRRKRHSEDDFFDSTFAYVGRGIWIGSLDTINDPAALKTAGIKSIVNISGWEPLSKTRAMYKKLGIMYQTLTSRDPRSGKLRYLGDEPIGGRLSLGEFYNYMDRGVEMVRRSPKPVIVNCHAGINRSASLVAAYLIARYGMTFAQARSALIEANKKRSIPVLTNRYFVNAMSRYSEYLQNKNGLSRR